MKLTFWGAAGTVTGSMHLVETGGKRVLLDCGLYQGRRKDADAKNRNLPFAGRVDRRGDSLARAHRPQRQSADAGEERVRRADLHDAGDHRPVQLDAARHGAHPGEGRGVPEQAAGAAARQHAGWRTATSSRSTRRRTRRRRSRCSSRCRITTPQAVDPGADATRASTPGTCSGRPSWCCRRRGRPPVRLGYSGDVGRPGLPIIRDPETMPPVDYLILESTYGGRLHKSVEHVVNKLADVVKRTAARGGKIIVPAFAVGRTQQLVLLLHQLANEKRIPNIPIFVDSPLAVNVTAGASRPSGVFRRGDARVPDRMARTRSASSGCNTSARPPIRRS